MLVGPNDLKNIFLPVAIDGAKLTQMRLENGTTLVKLLSDINDALTLARDRVMNDPLLTSISSTTTEAFVEYRIGSVGGFEEHTEYGEADEIRAETGGHMLPLRKFDRALGWSRDYLEKARQFQLDADVALAIQDYENLLWRIALTRLFSKNVLTGRKYELGNGKAMPFADGSASGDIYVPPAVPGRGFTGEATHDHYLRLAGKTQPNIEMAATNLWEHGFDGPFDMLVPDADVAEWTAVEGFKPRTSALVTAGANESLSTVDEAFVGVIVTKRGPVRLRANGRIESGFWNLHKTFGANDPRNPLRYRTDEKKGDAPYLDVPVARSLPVEGAIIQTRGDFGVGEDRTNSVNVMDAANGAYRDPVIS